MQHMRLASVFLVLLSSLCLFLLCLYLILSGTQEGRKEPGGCTQQGWFSLILSSTGPTNDPCLLRGETLSFSSTPMQPSPQCDVLPVHLEDAHLALWFLQRAFVWKQRAQRSNIFLCEHSKLGQKEKFCQLGGAPPLSLFSSWFCTAFITITESVNSLDRQSIYKEN